MAEEDVELNGSIKIQTDLSKAIQEINSLSAKMGSLQDYVEKADQAFKKLDTTLSGVANEMKKINSGYSQQNMSAKEQIELKKQEASAARAAARAAKAEAQAKIEVAKIRSQGTPYSRVRSSPEYLNTRQENIQAEQELKKEKVALSKERLELQKSHRTQMKAGFITDAIGSIGDLLKGVTPIGTSIGTGIHGATNIVKAGLVAGPAGVFITALKEAAAAVKQFSSAALDAYGQIESVRTQLGVVFGSKAQSEQMFEGISEYAVKSPFDVEGVSEMAVLLRQSGVYSSDLMDTLKMIGDTAGGNAEKMKRIANNYAQIVAVGKASMLDMRQFAYAGIPIYKETADYLGVSQERLRGMISDGKVTAEVMEEVFKRMTAEGGAFFEAVEKGAKTFQARLTNLEDTKQLGFASAGEWIVNMQNASGEGGVVNDILSLNERLFSWMKDFFEKNNIKKDVEQIQSNMDSGISLRIQRMQSLFLAKDPGSYPGLGRAVDIIDDVLQKYNATFSSDDIVSAYARLYEQNEQEKLKEENWDGVLHVIKNLKTAKSQVKAEINRIDPTDPKTLERFNLLSAEIETINEAIKELKKEKPRSHDEQTSQTIFGHSMQGMIADATKTAETVDKIQKGADSQQSWLSKFEEKYKQTEEYKKKNQEEQLSLAKKAVEEAQEFRSIASDIESGVKRAATLSMDDYIRLNTNYASADTEYMGKTADYWFDVKSAKKPEDYALQSDAQENWNILRGNIDDILSIMARELSSSNKSVSELQKVQKVFRNGSTESLTYKSFVKLTTALEGLQGFIKENYSGQERDRLLTLLNLRLRKGGYNTDLADKDPALFEQLESSANTNTMNLQPLWKRIIAGATGLDVDKMQGNAYDIMQEQYRQVASRNLVSGALASMFTEGNAAGDRLSLREIFSTLSYGGIGSFDNAGTLQTSSGKKVPNKSTQINRLGQDNRTLQIDWGNSEANLMARALSGGLNTATLKVIREGYNQQLNTMASLFADALSKGESAQYTNSFEGMMVNAYAGIALDERQRINGYLPTADGGRREVSLEYDKNLNVWKDASDPEIIVKNILDVEDAFENLQKFLVQYTATLQQKEKELAVQGVRQDFVDEQMNRMKDAKRSAGAYVPYSLAKSAAPEGASAETVKAIQSVVGEYFGSLLQAEMEAASARLEAYNGTLEKFAEIYGDGSIHSPEQDEQLVSLMADQRNGITSIAGYVYSISKILESNPTLKGEMESAAADTANAYEAEKQGQAFESVRSYVDSTSFNDILFKDFHPLFGSKGYNNAGQQAYMDRHGMTGSFQEYSQSIVAGVINGLSGIAPSEMNSMQRSAFNALGGEKGINELNAAGLENIDTSVLNKYADKLADIENLWVNIGTQIQDVSSGTVSIVKNFAADAFTSTFETIGENLVKGNDALDGAGDKMRELGQAALSNLGSLLVQAGLSIIAGNPGNWGAIGIGLAMIAAGGMASFLSGSLSAQEDEGDDSESEYERLKDIKNDLADLLEQARQDAIYYENELRHRNALSLNTGVSNKSTSVNDAIISSNGNIITTHPDDWLIATKNPKGLASGGNTTVSPKVNISIVNNSGRQLDVKQQETDDDGNVDIVAIIETVAGQYIASNRSDEAFSARDFRQKGRSVTA